jgi:hypothetical protein
MKNPIKTFAVLATGALLATSAFGQSAAALVVPIENEPATRLFVEPPLPGPLATGVAFIPYRVENLRIMPVGGPPHETYPLASVIYTLPSTTCHGSGRTTARAIPSSWLTCRAASISC